MATAAVIVGNFKFHIKLKQLNLFYGQYEYGGSSVHASVKTYKFQPPVFLFCYYSIFSIYQIVHFPYQLPHEDSISLKLNSISNVFYWPTFFMGALNKNNLYICYNFQAVWFLYSMAMSASLSVTFFFSAKLCWWIMHLTHFPQKFNLPTWSPSSWLLGCTGLR